MELNSATMRRVWWKGAISSALKGIPLGIGIAIVAAALLAFVAIPLAPAMANLFGGFLTFSGAPAFMPIIPHVGGAFFPIPLMIFNTALTVAAHAFTGGKIACNAYKQDVEHRMNEARITQIEAREMALEQDLTPSRTVQRIMAQGPRMQQSFEQAERVRAEKPSGPVLH